jgi:hypothetical protein
MFWWLMNPYWGRLVTDDYYVVYSSNMIKDFLMRKMLERQMKDVPKEQQELLIKAVSEHPELFTEIATKIKTRVDGGEDQMKAAMAVMMDYKDQLQGVLGK